MNGADCRSRTGDLLISHLFYAVRVNISGSVANRGNSCDLTIIDHFLSS